MANISNILDPDVRARALARIGYFDDTKKQGRQVDYRRLLGWFVDFSRKDLAKMSSAEVLLLQEEIHALYEEHYRYYEGTASTAKHLPKTQAIVAHDLEQLTKTGRIDFEDFKLRPFILLPRFSPLPTTPYKYNIFIGELVEPFDGKGLLYLLFESLKDAGDRLRYCKHCSTLFVQARRKQQFCTRQHQQVASMRALRAIQPKEREARKTKKRSSQVNRRASHGKKRR